MSWPQMLLSLAAVIVSAAGAVSWVNAASVRASRDGALTEGQAPTAVALTVVFLTLVSVAGVLAGAAVIV